ncbi:MAG: hypothetical protein R2684_14410 [Pyrinomonadaceae bacterium]
MKAAIGVLLIVFIVLSTNCSWNKSDKFNLEKYIGDYLKIYCKGKSDCRFRLNEVTPFKWDKFYFFDASIEGHRIVEITGISVDYKENMKRKFIFVKNNRIVYFEENESDIESAVEGEINFQDADRKNYAVFDYSAEFRVSPAYRGFAVECLNCENTQ